MAVNNINNNTALLNSIYNLKTNGTNGIDKISGNSIDTNALKVDSFSPSTLSQLSPQNSGYLNYGSTGTYANPSLPDFLNSSSSGSSDDISDLLDGSSDSSDDSDSTDSDSQFDTAFDDLANEMTAQNTQLINNTIAKMSNKTDA